MSSTERIDPTSLVARIIAELQANPAAQRLLLRALLTNEFLGMPARLDRVEKDIAELKADVAELKVDVAELKVDVAELKTDVAELKTDVASLKTDVAYLKGSDLEYRLHRKVHASVCQAFALRRPHTVKSPVKEPDKDFLARVDEALQDGLITQEQDTRIEATDFILQAQRRTDGVPLWIAVEASSKVHDNDMQRVRATADALHTVFDGETLAIVAGYQMDEPQAKRAKAAGVEYLQVAPPIPI